MITAREEDSQKLMMDAAVELVASDGFEGFTTKKWAARAGVAEGSLYYHFKSKDDLLEKTFVMIDKGIAGLFADYAEAMKLPLQFESFMKGMWKTYYEYLLANPEKTLYYYRFRTSTRYNQKIQEGQLTYFSKFLSIINTVNEATGMLRHITWEVLWVYIIDTTLAFAFRVITGGIKHTPDTQQQMLDIFAGGVLGVVRDAMDQKGGDASSKIIL